jgi:hypothetical protein
LLDDHQRTLNRIKAGESLGHSPYRNPVHAAVLRDFERPDRYLARVSTREAHDTYAQRRDDCARQLAAARR